MTAPVAPMEARCEHCHDTGSLSKHMDGDLDCLICEAAEHRVALRKHLRKITGWPDSDHTAWAAYLFAQRQAALKALNDERAALVGKLEREALDAKLAPVAPHPSDKAASFWSEVEASNHEVRPAQQVEAVGPVPYGWVNAGIDRALTFYATLNVGAKNPWVELANAFPVYTAPQLEAQQAGDVESVARAMAKHVGWNAWDTATNVTHTPDGSELDDERDYWRGLAQVAIAQGRKA